MEGIGDGQHGVLVSEILHAKSELEAPTNDKAHIEIVGNSFNLKLSLPCWWIDQVYVFLL